jgi:pimeloyl-ACP methyl ester carboxylesterase
MANGFGGSRWHGVDRFARVFADAGFAVLLHDHRNFGTSGGTERGDADPWRQISDWQDAIGFLRDRPEVAVDRIGLWGTGYAGGHALVIGATDRRLSAIVAQLPTLHGLGREADGASTARAAQLEGLFREDCRRRLAGEPGLRLTLASSETALLAPYRSAEALAFFHQDDAMEMWENEITVRSLRASTTYVPEAWLHRVSPTPLMLVVNADDAAATYGPALASGDAEGAPGEVVTLSGGHFSPFLAEFSQASAAAKRWFVEHL